MSASVLPTPSTPPSRRPGARHSTDARNEMPSFIGRDLGPEYDPRRASALVPLLILVLVTALGIAALRIDLIRTRYAVAQATQTENTLIEEQRALIARKRQLRDPVSLAIKARERGFRPPTRVYSLADPVVGEGAGVPAVAAAPPRGSIAGVRAGSVVPTTSAHR